MMNIVKDLDVELPFEINTAVVFCDSKLVILTTQGNVMFYDTVSHEVEHLFETNPTNGIVYGPGSFDPTAKSSIYVKDDVIVVVNDYKRHGLLCNGKQGYLIHFMRTDDHADFSKFPIALYKNEDDVMHLIYAVAWNHLQIVNLDTRQVVTADKSLMAEGAEEEHIGLYKRIKEENKLFWPDEYDYFFGELFMSSDDTYFLSAGWVWGSHDCYKGYVVNEFINNHRIQDETICYGEHEARGVCFIDNDRIGVLFDPFAEAEVDEENVAPGTPCEIRLYGIRRKASEEKIVINSSLPLVKNSRLYYQDRKSVFIILSKQEGLLIVSQDGSITLHLPDFFPQHYDKDRDCFISYEGNHLTMYHMDYEP